MCIHKVAMNISDRDYLLDKLESILHDTYCQQYKDEICEAFSKYITTESVSDLKPFDLNAAKAGNPVCTRDGRKARIICFDAKYDLPIVALVTEDGGKENLIRYNSNGRYTNLNKTDCDLMMLPEKKEGWMNLYDDIPIYDTKEEALSRKSEIRNLIDAIKVSWEE